MKTTIVDHDPWSYPAEGFRKPTQAEQLDAWKHLAFEMNLHRTITMNNGAVVKCLERIDAWVGAHSDRNGEKSEKDIELSIRWAFWNFICKNPVAGLKDQPKAPGTL